MDLALNESEQLVQDTARRLLAPHAAVEALATAEASPEGFDERLWKRFGELGWTGQGGSGGGLVMTGLLAGELGRAAVASPFLVTVTTGIVLDRLGSTAEAQDLLRRVAAGTARAAMAAPGVHPPSTEVVGETLSGGPWLVEWGTAVDTLVVLVSGRGGVALLAVARDDLDIVPVRATDNERLSTISADRAPTIRLTDGVVGEDALTEALVAGDLLRAASLVGTAERALELTVSHVREREQFGQPLGRFQAVQHKCADIATAVDGARLAVLQALSRAGHGLSFAADAAVASYFAGRAAEIAVVEGAQLHGGLGFMAEYELSFHFRRAKAGQLRLGGEVHQLEAVAARLAELMAAGWEGG